MKRRSWLHWTAGILIGAGLALQVGAAESESETRDPVVWLGRIDGTINPATASYLENTIRKAERDSAEAVVIEMDTPGGLLASTRKMAQAMAEAEVPVVIYVTPAGASATSAGALLMLASHVAAMTPGSNIGAAHPVGPQGKDVEGAMGEKVVQDTAAFARGLAEIRGRNVELAEQVVSKSASMTANEAIEKNFIEVLARDRAELFTKLDGREVKIDGRGKTIRTEGAVVRQSEMTTGQTLLHYLANPNIAAILMGLGMLLIYIEISNPGLTVAGVLGGVCLLTAFIAFQVLPIRVGGLVLLLLGMGLMIAEPFVGSGGILAGGGLLMFVLGLLWVLDPSETDLRIEPEVWVPLTVGMAAGVAVVAWAAARMRTLQKEALGRIGGASVAGLQGYRGKVDEVANDGLSGSVSFRGEYWNFLSDVPVKTGDWVEATKVDGLRVRVTPVSGPTPKV